MFIYDYAMCMRFGLHFEVCHSVRLPRTNTHTMVDEMDSILSKLGLGICSAAFHTENISPDIVCKLSMYELRYLGVNDSADMMKLRVECIKYGPAINNNRNEPAYDISKNVLETLIESGFKICEISKLLSVSERTVHRRMSKYQLSVYHFTSIDDDALQREVVQVTNEFPRVGETLIRHILHQKGIKVSNKTVVHALVQTRFSQTPKSCGFDSHSSQWTTNSKQCDPQISEPNNTSY